MREHSIAMIFCVIQIFTFGNLSVGKETNGSESVGSIRRKAKEALDKVKPLVRNREDVLYLVDFDNTIHTQEGRPIRMEGFIDRDVIMKSLLDRASEVDDENSEKIRDFLVARSVELRNYRVDSFTTVQKLFRNSEEFRRDISKSVGVFFSKMAAPNHRISYLLEFGCSRDQIEANYTNMSRDYIRYYEGMMQNPVVVEIICQLLHANKKVVIFTDNSEANVLVGVKHIKLEETITKRLAELGTKLDPKVPIISGETDINGILPMDLSVKPLIPIISMFKRRPNISEHFFEISTKKCPNSKEILERELSEKYGIDTKNTKFVIFDDSLEILENLEKQGVVPVHVDKSNVAPLVTGAAGRAKPKTR
ncbi:MAG: hypothetical protein LBB24_00885 [Rickettsiales bacterium]|nr:hypothetical protein [Rickettsiales bacterium]